MPQPLQEMHPIGSRCFFAAQTLQLLLWTSAGERMRVTTTFSLRVSEYGDFRGGI